MLNLIGKPFQVFKRLIKRGQDWSVNKKNNIPTSFLVETGKIFVSLIWLLRTIKNVNREQYGTWRMPVSPVRCLGYFNMDFAKGLPGPFTKTKEHYHELAGFYTIPGYLYRK